MIHSIREAFNELLDENDWMDDETRAVLLNIFIYGFLIFHFHFFRLFLGSKREGKCNE